MEEKKKIPRFKSRQEEAEFWDKADVTDYFDESDEVEIEVAKPLSHIISVRLDQEHMRKLSGLAKRQGVGITTMARMLLYHQLDPGDADPEDVLERTRVQIREVAENLGIMVSPTVPPD